MAKASPAFQFYPSDFVMGTLHLDAEATGCYILLLCHQWTHGVLPCDPEKLARICRASPKSFERIWSDIGDKFAPCDGGLVNERLESVRGKQRSTSEKREAAGRKGGKRKASDVA